MPNFVKSACIAALIVISASSAFAATVNSSLTRQGTQFYVSLGLVDSAGNRSGTAFSYQQPSLFIPSPEDGGNGIFGGYANFFVSRDGLYPFEPIRPQAGFQAVVDQTPDRPFPFTDDIGLYDLRPLTFSTTTFIRNLFGSDPSFLRFGSDNRVDCVGPCELAFRNRLTGEVIASDLFLTSGRYTLAPIPVPASGAMLAGAVGLFAFFRRRRSV